MPVIRDSLGFDASYRIEIDPEFPPDGAWGIPSFTFGRGGALMLRVTPEAGQSWVASFEQESRGFLNGVYATPAPSKFVVLTGIDAFLVDAGRPGAVEKLPIAPTVAVARPVGIDLLLIGSFTDATALDAGGLRWATHGLFIDDLEFVTGPPGRILVRGTLRSVPSEPKTLELDPKSGRIAGT